MKGAYRWTSAAVLFAALQWAGCGKPVIPAGEDNAGPAKVEHFKGAEPARVTLTEAAVRRLGIRTEMVRNAVGGGATRRVIPYAAVLYDTGGDTWMYANPSPGVFVRHHITIELITGEQAVLSDGPPVGTAVVVVGAAELYGSETEFEEE